MSEELAIEALLEFLNACEAGIVAARQRIKAVKIGQGDISADFNKLFWETKQGTKGEYQQTSKRSTNNSDVFQALQRKLRENNGFWQHQGFKYWFHRQDRDVIDRRKIQA